MKQIVCNQRSPEWLEARAGRVTASNVAASLAFLKRKSKNGEPGEESQARKDYKARVVAEILTGRSMEQYVSAAMEWGNEYETFARAAYETSLDKEVERVGFVLHPTIERAGASPDGLVGNHGLIEIKCPNTTTHLDYIVANVVPEDYQPQMLWQMACTGREWCDFVSYDPRMPDHLQLFVKMFHRDEARIAEMEAGVRKFLSEVDEFIARLPKAEYAEAACQEA